jgi:hypothetical protein
MIVSHLLLILHKKIQFYIFMFEAWNVAKGHKVQGGRILSQGTVSSNHKQFVRQFLNSLGCLQFISILRFISAYFSDSFAYKQTCGEKLQVELTLWTRVKPAGIMLCNLL